MAIEMKQSARILAVLTCLLVVLAACAVTNPTPAPTARPNVSPLNAVSPVKLPDSSTPGPCDKGCLEPTLDCTIKGVVTGMGQRLYYTPDMPGYRDKVPLVQYGGRWFCTVDMAVRNGFQMAPAQ